MIVHWLLVHTDAIDVRVRDGKTFYVMTDPDAFGDGVGELLGEVQRIKSQGDYEAARDRFETFGIHVDADLRDQVLEQVAVIDLPSYSAFVMPRLEAVREDDGEIVGVTISCPMDLTQQMLEYSGKR
jgi:dipeptidyl-peptidase-3